MKNPWINLPKIKPYVLEKEKDDLRKFNSNNNGILPLNRIPEPFMGDPFSCKAPLLNLNPGFHRDDVNIHNNNELFRKLSFGNLLHETAEYPFYRLNPDLEDTPGNGWWNKHMKNLITDVSIASVAKKLCVVEIFPYHSESGANFDELSHLETVKYS